MEPHIEEFNRLNDLANNIEFSAITKIFEHEGKPAAILDTCDLVFDHIPDYELLKDYLQDNTTTCSVTELYDYESEEHEDDHDYFLLLVYNG